MTFKVKAAEFNSPQTLEAVRAEPAAVALAAGLARGLRASAAVSHTHADAAFNSTPRLDGREPGGV